MNISHENYKMPTGHSNCSPRELYKSSLLLAINFKTIITSYVCKSVTVCKVLENLCRKLWAII